MSERAELQVVEPGSAVPAQLAPSGAAAILAVIERAALNPAVDIDKMERLLEMQERILAREAEMAFNAAFAAMQPRLPTIERNGQIIIREKGGDKIIQTTAFATFEDINEAIRPVLADHGFALSFRTGTATDGKLTVTGVLSHAAGHKIETTLPLMHDSTGSKNAVQAVGSAVSYGRRYTTLALLNITSRAKTDADDDGTAAGAEAVITDEQCDTLRNLITETRADIALFLKFFGVPSLPDIPASRYDEAVAKLNAKKAMAARGRP